MKICLLSLGLPLGLAGLAAAQSTISATDKYAHVANAGWLNFRTTAADGVVVAETYLSGRAYAANFGWLDLGDGTPANGYRYANNSATDSGVNLSDTGELSGYAYSANVGWINFEQTHGKPKLDFLTGKLTGYAYSANLGWIGLDTSFSDLVTLRLAIPDTDGDGIADAYEKYHIGNLTKLNAISDADGDGVSDAKEYAANTVPTNSADYPRILSQTHNAAHTYVTLSFTSRPNRLYGIDHNADLTGTWSDSGWQRFAPAAGTTTIRSFSYPAGPRRFFRVTAHLPLQP